ncbi:MAG: non-homologous end-joining DNA ligase [Gemmataceae bacterium]
MMATLVSGPFDHADWIFEPKFDGLRVLAYCTPRGVTLISRNEKPQEFQFPDIAEALKKAVRKPVVVDGEIVCFDERGRTSFRALQQRFHLTQEAEIAIRAAKYPASIYLFDLLWLNGRDVTHEPLVERKRLLRKAMRWSQRVRWTEFTAMSGTTMFRKACRHGEEGIIGKLASSIYVAARSPAWMKIKCVGRQEFVIGGYTDPQRSRVGLGALLVGYYDGDILRYAGKVGTGFTHDKLLALRKILDRRTVSKCPFAAGDMPRGAQVHWVRPELVAEIGFSEWTQNDMLRQPRFEGLREDKLPRDCKRERPRLTSDDVREAEAAMPTKHASNGKALKDYRAKRNFRETPEPGPKVAKSHKQAIFVIQEHHATRLHYDFRLEYDGVLKSWAVTKRPSLDPDVRRLAVRVEDHPIAYAKFAGEIPEGHYGAGTVSIWDNGTYESADPSQTIGQGLDAGRLSIVLHGKKLKGRFALVRMGGPAKKENWLLIKSRDEYAKPGSESESPSAKPAKAPVKKKAPIVRTEGSQDAPRQIEVTHPEKVIDPEGGFTKQDVAEYYRKVAKRLLPFLKDRPVTLERLPDGLSATKPHFWQKNTPASYPAWIPRAELETELGKPVSYVLVNDLQTLMYLVNQGTLTFHPWLSRVGDLDRPDFVLFDLDIDAASFADAVDVAKHLHEVLTEDKKAAFVKTSGKTGLHIFVPWRESGGYGEARAWASQVATEVANALPKQATVEIRRASRGKRVYIDVMQNVRGHHAVPPYVVRAVPGLTVSTPLRWANLTEDLDVTKFNIRTVPQRLAWQKADPIAGLMGGRRAKVAGRNR